MRSLIALVMLVSVAAACGDDGHDHDHDGEHLLCQGDEETFTPGMSKLGDNGFFKLHILSIAPDPLAVDNNTFTVRVTDPSDTPVDGITFDVAETWQRVHDHGTPVVSVVTPLANTGEFEISPLNVIHTGSWLFRFGPNDGTNADYVVFNFGVQCPN
jgi:hypothetical protein